MVTLKITDKNNSAHLCVHMWIFFLLFTKKGVLGGEVGNGSALFVSSFVLHLQY